MGKTFVLALIIAAVSGASAPAEGRRTRRAPKLDIGKVAVDLASTDVTTVARAVEALIAAAPKLKKPEADQASMALAKALALGASPAVAAELLKGLAELGGAHHLELIRRYLAHRRARVRIAALRALARAGGKQADAQVVAGLSDHEADVRRAAADIIAEQKIRAGIEPLLTLLKRGDPSVVAPIGKLADPDIARAVSELIGAAPDALVSRALGAILLNSKFGPEEARVEVVKALSQVPGSESIEALSAYLSAVPAKPPRESRQEAELAVERRVSEGGQ